MSLGGAALVAKSSLSISAEQIAIVARNVDGSGDVDVHRKVARPVSRDGGGVVLSVVERVDNAQLAATTLEARSQASAAQTMAETLDRLVQAASGPDLQDSPSAAIARLSDALQLWGATPADRMAANATVDAARGLAEKINSVAGALDAARVDVDRSINAAVSDLGDALSALEQQNQAILQDAGARDVTDALDARDREIGRIAELIDVRVLGRAGQDVLLTTRGGAMLFETTARPLQFSPTADLSSGRDGVAVRVDGVPLEAKGAATAIGGRIGALLELRDQTLPALQRQLDELARVLIDTFAEPDQSGGGAPAMPGLFDGNGFSGVPPVGAPIAGLALALRVNPAVDPQEGGTPERIRDGGATGPGDPRYVSNPSGDAGYATRLIALTKQLETPRAVDPGIGFGGTLSTGGMARAVDGALQGWRRDAHDRHDRSTAVLVRATAAFTGEVGVNLDNELSHMLELERSYQASSRLITAIDQMLATLLDAVGRG